MTDLKHLYDKVILDANSQATWYTNKKKGISRMSRAIRSYSIVFVSAGGLFPLIGAATKGNILGYDVTNWGYISIALAGTLIFLDRFFGFSTAWIRYTTTELEIRKQIKDFEMKWVIATCGLEMNAPCDPKTTELLTLLKDFSALIDELVKQETNTWALEFQTNIAELQKTINSKLEASTPGSVKVSVENAQGYQNLSVKIDNLVSNPISGNTILLTSISNGHHLVTVTGQAGGRTVEAADVVTVEPNKLASVVIKMP